MDIFDIQSFLNFLKKHLYTNFSIGDNVAGTTPVTTLRKPLSYVCKNSDEDSAPSGRTDSTDNLHIISLAPSVGMTFSHLGSKA